MKLMPCLPSLIPPDDGPQPYTVTARSDAMFTDRLPRTNLRRRHEAVDPGEGTSQQVRRVRTQG